MLPRTLFLPNACKLDFLIFKKYWNCFKGLRIWMKLVTTDAKNCHSIASWIVPMIKLVSANAWEKSPNAPIVNIIYWLVLELIPKKSEKFYDNFQNFQLLKNLKHSWQFFKNFVDKKFQYFVFGPVFNTSKDGKIFWKIRTFLSLISTNRITAAPLITDLSATCFSV